jgi:putative transferase (TIGR04331 family)
LSDNTLCIVEEGKKYMHLVTTALREFWPESGSIWLLSAGCLPLPEDLSSASPWEVKGIVQDPWDSQINASRAYKVIEGIYDRLLPALVYRMNLIHGTSYSDRYWRILLGVWLQAYVNVLYDRCQRLLYARAKLGAIETIGLDESCFIVPANTLEYIYEVTDDRYNLQIYTRLCKSLDFPLIEVRKPHTAPNPQKILQLQYGRIKNIFRNIQITSYGIAQKVIAPRAKIILNSSYHSRTFNLMLTIATGCKVWDFIDRRCAISQGSVVNLQMRNALRLDLNGISECEKVIAENLHIDVPKIFVEDYTSLCKSSAAIYMHLGPEVILSMNSWWFDEAFKHWAACCAERGTILVGGQHGGNYGVSRNHWAENHEKKIVDKYFTWGWPEIRNPKVVPTPASKLINIKKRPNKISGRRILFTGTAEARFNVGIRKDFANYLNWQHRFFRSVSPELTEEFRVRLHYADYGWGIKRRLEKAFPKLEYDIWNRPFRQSLHDCRLFVCDHLSTTYAEALASNVPTVLYWNEDAIPIRESANPIINELKTCRILHDTPESAAAWIGKVYPKLEDWWLLEQTQQTVLKFCSKHARTSKTPLRDWVLLLNRLLMKNES